MIKEFKNFLPIDEFKNLQNLIFFEDFPWRIRKSMTNTDKNIYFTYSFFNQGNNTSDYYDSLIKPILNKLKYKAVIEARANMFLNKLFNKEEV